MSYDPFYLAKLQNAQKNMRSPAPKEYSIDEMKRLAGIQSPTQIHGVSAITTADKARYMKEHNIRPGTEAWFRLWFARPDITGETPF